jgi:hypothetical protein
MIIYCPSGNLCSPPLAGGEIIVFPDEHYLVNIKLTPEMRCRPIVLIKGELFNPCRKVYYLLLTFGRDPALTENGSD